MINDLDDIDFLKDVFQIKMNITDGDLHEATKSGPGIFDYRKEGGSMEDIK